MLKLTKKQKLNNNVTCFSDCDESAINEMKKLNP